MLRTSLKTFGLSILHTLGCDLRRTNSKKKFLFFRNSPVNCDVFPQLNLHYWKTDSPALQVPEAILIQTLEKGTQGLAQRRKEEYKLWELSKKYVLFFLEKKSKCFLCISYSK